MNRLSKLSVFAILVLSISPSGCQPTTPMAPTTPLIAAPKLPAAGSIGRIEFTSVGGTSDVRITFNKPDEIASILAALQKVDWTPTKSVEFNYGVNFTALKELAIVQKDGVTQRFVLSTERQTISFGPGNWPTNVKELEALLDSLVQAGKNK